MTTRASLLLAVAFAPLGSLAYCVGVHVSSMCQCLGQGLVGAAAVVVGTVGEEEVDDEADDREDEDSQAPEQLVDGRAVGL